MGALQADNQEERAIVLTATQPFTSMLVMSNREWFRYEWVWDKVRISGHLDANRKPLRQHENACIFYDEQPTYNPQMIQGLWHKRGCSNRPKRAEVYSSFNDTLNFGDTYFPTSILTINGEQHSEHPTQKPVALGEYLIRTYTNEGETVLDNCMGSGSFGVAAVKTGRSFIGMELDRDYFEIAYRRIRDAQAQGVLL